MLHPAVRFRVDFGREAAIGPGKIALLEAIRDRGSLSQAAREVGMSYRRAWLLVESLRQTFREPVTLASSGGKDGGGMRVTRFGNTLIRNYRELEREFAALAKRRLDPIVGTVARRPQSFARTSVRGRVARENP